VAQLADSDRDVVLAVYICDDDESPAKSRREFPPEETPFSMA